MTSTGVTNQWKRAKPFRAHKVHGRKRDWQNQAAAWDAHPVAVSGSTMLGATGPLEKVPPGYSAETLARCTV